MTPRPHLVVHATEDRYGLPADRVHQVLWLPVLSASDRGGAWIGTAHLDEEALDVADLDRVFGREPSPYTLDHRLVDVDTAGGRMGLVVADVAEVVPIEDVEHRQDGGPVAGLALVGGEPLELLDVDALPAAADEASEPSVPVEELFGAFSRDQIEELARRQRRLTGATHAREAEPGGVLAKAGGGSFVLPLEAVRAFVQVGDLVPVPATPDRVRGLVNHEGEVVVVVDVASVLGLPGGVEGPPFVVAMVERAGGLTGVAVERVDETVDLSEVTAAADETGVASWVERGDDAVPVLDLEALLTSEELVVDQEA